MFKIVITLDKGITESAMKYIKSSFDRALLTSSYAKPSKRGVLA